MGEGRGEKHVEDKEGKFTFSPNFRRASLEIGPKNLYLAIKVTMSKESLECGLLLTKSREHLVF